VGGLEVNRGLRCDREQEQVLEFAGSWGRNHGSSAG
jgi:hypothetical protein